MVYEIINSSNKILKCFNFNNSWIFDLDTEIKKISKGQHFNVPVSVFEKITTDKVTELNNKYNK